MWHKIFFNANNIIKSTNKAVLIKMPNNSEYVGCEFWHPAKLVREQGGKGYHCTFSFTEDFKFTVVKKGRGQHNKFDNIREYTLNCKDMLQAFGIVDKNVNDFVEMETDKIIEKEILENETIIEHHKPEIINPLENNIIDGLTR